MIQIEIITNRQTEFISITDQIQTTIHDSSIENGVCYIYIPHTTAAVTINENADPMVVHDILHIIDRIIPFGDNGYRHMEANSAAHIKCCLFGTSKTILIQGHRLVLGIWQGIFFANLMAPRIDRCT